MLGLSPCLSVLVVAPLVGLLGMAIQRLVIQPLRDEPNLQIFATFGLLMMFQNIMLALSRGEALSVGGQVGADMLTLGSMKISVVRLVTFVATTLITIGLHLFLSRTLAGKAIRAVTQDKRAARAIGINVERTFLITFGIGTALAGMAGVLLTPIYSITPAVGGNFILAAFAVVVLGGLGSVWGACIGGLIGGVGTIAGPLLGAALVIPFENFLRAELANSLPGMNLAILGLLMVLAALFMKRGIVGALRDLMHRFEARKGEKK